MNATPHDPPRLGVRGSSAWYRTGTPPRPDGRRDATTSTHGRTVRLRPSKPPPPFEYDELVERSSDARLKQQSLVVADRRRRRTALHARKATDSWSVTNPSGCGRRLLPNGQHLITCLAEPGSKLVGSVGAGFIRQPDGFGLARRIAGRLLAW